MNRRAKIEEKINMLIAQATKSSKNMATILGRFLKTEQIKKLFQRMSKLLREKTSDITHIETPTNSSNNPKNIINDQKKLKIIDTLENIFNALKERNQ